MNKNDQIPTSSKNCCKSRFSWDPLRSRLSFIWLSFSSVSSKEFFRAFNSRISSYCSEYLCNVIFSSAWDANCCVSEVSEARVVFASYRHGQVFKRIGPSVFKRDWTQCRTRRCDKEQWWQAARYRCLSTADCICEQIRTPTKVGQFGSHCSSSWEAERQVPSHDRETAWKPLDNSILLRVNSTPWQAVWTSASGTWTWGALLDATQVRVSHHRQAVSSLVKKVAVHPLTNGRCRDCLVWDVDEACRIRWSVWQKTVWTKLALPSTVTNPPRRLPGEAWRIPWPVWSDTTVTAAVLPWRAAWNSHVQPPAINARLTTRMRQRPARENKSRRDRRKKLQVTGRRTRCSGLSTAHRAPKQTSGVWRPRTRLNRDPRGHVRRTRTNRGTGRSLSTRKWAQAVHFLNSLPGMMCTPGRVKEARIPDNDEKTCLTTVCAAYVLLGFLCLNDRKRDDIKLSKIGNHGIVVELWARPPVLLPALSQASHSPFSVRSASYTIPCSVQTNCLPLTETFFRSAASRQSTPRTTRL